MRNMLFQCNYENLFCDTFGCRLAAKWFLGDPSGPLNMAHKLCDACVAEMIRTFPIDVLHHVLVYVESKGYRVVKPNADVLFISREAETKDQKETSEEDEEDEEKEKETKIVVSKPKVVRTRTTRKKAANKRSRGKTKRG